LAKEEIRHHKATPSRTQVNFKRLAIICLPLVVATVFIVLFIDHFSGTNPKPQIVIVEKNTISLFLPTNGGKLVEQTVDIKGTETHKEKGAKILAELKKGGAVPEKLALQELVTDSDGIMYLNFSKDLVTGVPGGGPVGEIATVFSIVNSFLANFRSARKVQILVDWQPVHTLHGIVYTYLPMEFNKTIMED